MGADSTPLETLSIEATTHGRVLVQRAQDPMPAAVLVGCHGYMENAALQMMRMRRIPGANRWTLVAVQGLHRFYRGRTHDVVASWMTSEDRETAITDNIEYVSAALRAVLKDVPAPARIVYAGFSQGVAMAFRAALRGGLPASGVIAVGGDVPPELLADPSLTFPPVLLARGAADDLYAVDKFDADLSALRARDVRVEPYVYEAGHQWTADVSAAVAGWLERL